MVKFVFLLLIPFLFVFNFVDAVPIDANFSGDYDVNACYSDVIGDGVVNAIDYLQVSAAIDSTRGQLLNQWWLVPADINSDKRVDTNDTKLLSQRYNELCQEPVVKSITLLDLQTQNIYDTFSSPDIGSETKTIDLDTAPAELALIGHTVGPADSLEFTLQADGTSQNETITDTQFPFSLAGETDAGRFKSFTTNLPLFENFLNKNVDMILRAGSDTYGDTPSRTISLNFGSSENNQDFPMISDNGVDRHWPFDDGKVIIEQGDQQIDRIAIKEVMGNGPDMISSLSQFDPSQLHGTEQIDEGYVHQALRLGYQPNTTYNAPAMFFTAAGFPDNLNTFTFSMAIKPNTENFKAPVDEVADVWIWLAHSDTTTKIAIYHDHIDRNRDGVLDTIVPRLSVPNIGAVTTKAVYIDGTRWTRYDLVKSNDEIRLFANGSLTAKATGVDGISFSEVSLQNSGPIDELRYWDEAINPATIFPPMNPDDDSNAPPYEGQ